MVYYKLKRIKPLEVRSISGGNSSPVRGNSSPVRGNLTNVRLLNIRNNERLEMKKVSRSIAVKRFMESDALAQAFVLEAIHRYAAKVFGAPDLERDTGLITQAIWKAKAYEALGIVTGDDK